MPITIQKHGATSRVIAFALLIVGASALAQQTNRLSFQADSVALDLEGKGSVFTGLTVIDGAVTIYAAEGATTNDGGENGVWMLRGGLRIVIDTATLTADTGTLVLADGVLKELELVGDPVTLDAPVGGESRQLRLTAGRIAYDATRRVLSVSEGAVFSSDDLEIRNCTWTYDLSDKSVEAVAETSSKCIATVATNRR